MLFVIIIFCYSIFNIERLQIYNKTKKISNKNFFNRSIININNYNQIIKESKLILYYFDKVCNYKLKLFKKTHSAKISIIIPVYNKESYLLLLMKSIQMQYIENLEIIFVDDKSNDSRTKIINYLSKVDKRIKLISNLENKGTFYSRNLGSSQANGDYIYFVDTDDLLFSGFNKGYEVGKKYNLDIVELRFIDNLCTGFKISRRFMIEGNILYQPDITYKMNNKMNNKFGSYPKYHLWSKLYKKKLVRKALNFIGSNFLKEIIDT